MLYKNYHRNFIRQFKKGVGVKSDYSNDNFIISEVEIFIDYDWEINIIIKDGKKKWGAGLILLDGTINSKVRIKEDAIQEIS